MNYNSNIKENVLIDELKVLTGEFISCDLIDVKHSSKNDREREKEKQT